MKNTIIALFIAVFTINSAISQQTESRKLADFDDIYIKGKVELHLIKSKKSSIEIEISDRYDMKRVISEVRNDKLKIYYDKKNRRRRTPKIVIYLYHDNIKEMEFDGVVDLESEDIIKGSKFTIDGNGIVRGKLEIDVETLQINMNGISNISISGKANDAKLNIGGLGKINASKLEAVRLHKSINGLAKIRT